MSFTKEILSGITKDYGLLGCKLVSTPMEPNSVLPYVSTKDDPLFDNITGYQKFLGKLIYLTHTRPATFGLSGPQTLRPRLLELTNNLQKWKQVPEECETYIGHYMLGEQYRKDVELVTDKAAMAYNATSFNAWVEEAAAPAIPGSLKLYRQLIELGFNIVFLTGTEEAYAEAREFRMEVEWCTNQPKEKHWKRVDIGLEAIWAINGAIYLETTLAIESLKCPIQCTTSVNAQ
ncbi:acid phosphatase, class B-like protein [Tanacetum coccineum]